MGRVRERNGNEGKGRKVKGRDRKGKEGKRIEGIGREKTGREGKGREGKTIVGIRRRNLILSNLVSSACQLCCEKPFSLNCNIWESGTRIFSHQLLQPNSFSTNSHPSQDLTFAGYVL